MNYDIENILHEEYFGTLCNISKDLYSFAKECFGFIPNIKLYNAGIFFLCRRLSGKIHKQEGNIFFLDDL